MNRASASLCEATREEHKPPYYSIPKVVADIFQPNMPPACFGVYSVLARRDNFTLNPNNSMRKLAVAANVSPAMASRAIETLVYLELIERSRHGGSQPDSYKLLDPWEAAKKWGAVYQNKSVSYALSQENRQSLKARVEAIQAGQRGTQTVSETVSGVSPETRQRFSGKRQRARSETQMGSHLLQEERRIEEDPPPTPARSIAAQKSNGSSEESKDSPDEDEPDPPLRWARIKFTGLMKDMGSHLLETNIPRVPHLANGADDWREFGLDSLAVEAAEWRGEKLALVLSASDPAAARRGLVKYHRTWGASLGKWYQCEVEWDLCEAKRT